MSSGIEDLLPMVAMGAMTGGMGSLGGLAGGMGSGAATGAATGAAGNALAAQGAAGLLGTAGAQAAGYGAPALLGSAAASSLPKGMAAFGNNGEFTGPTIGSELNANPFTGGFDNKSLLGQGFDQITTGMNDKTLGDGMSMFKGRQQQPQQQPKNVQMNTQARQQQPSSPASFVQLSNNQPVDPEQQRYEWLKRLGYV
jgi:hypothetical protein